LTPFELGLDAASGAALEAARRLGIQNGLFLTFDRDPSRDPGEPASYGACLALLSPDVDEDFDRVAFRSLVAVFHALRVKLGPDRLDGLLASVGSEVYGPRLAERLNPGR